MERHETSLTDEIIDAIIQNEGRHAGLPRLAAAPHRTPGAPAAPRYPALPRTDSQLAATWSHGESGSLSK
jgi:hypothetical protein